MNDLLRCLTPVTLALALVGCGAAHVSPDAEAVADNGPGASSDEAHDVSPDGTRDSDFDTATLAEYRSVIPTAEQLEAPAPGGQPDPNALTLTGTSPLATLAAGSAVVVNTPAVLLIVGLRAITLFPPTLYDSQKQEFVWGPWDNKDGYGKSLVYIRKNADDADFRYSYALVRLDGNDLDAAVPVIWGAGTPESEDDGADDVTGAGVALWDFEANNLFDATYDPNYDPDAMRDEGRFVTLFGKGQNDEGSFRFNVAVFRDFLAKKRKPDAVVANVDYFFGHFDGNDGNSLDFVDWTLNANICGDNAQACFDNATADDLQSGHAEALGLRAAFYNRGVGRAEAKIMGGDLPNTIDAVECWDASIDRTYVGIADDGAMVVEEGMCADAFADGLAAMGIPTFADLDADMVAKMDCVATNGTQCPNL